MTLVNGTIVHNVGVRSFLNTQFKSEVLNVVFSAILTTLLAYQLSAICYNIFLGFKSKGRATASDFHKLILSEASSPLSIVAAVTRNDHVDRLRFKREIPRNVRIVRRETSVTKKVTFSLVTLLLVAPLFNLVSIFIVLQKDEELTFGMAKFPGVALGLTQADLLLLNDSTSCDRVAMRLEGAPGAPISQFIICYEIEYSPLANMSGDTVRLSVELTPQGLLEVRMTTLPRNISASIGIALDLAADGQLYRTQPFLDSSDVAPLVRDGQRHLAEYCDAAKESVSPFNPELLKTEDVNGTFTVWKDFKCNVPSAQSYKALVPEMLEKVGIRENVPFKVVNEKDLNREATSAPEYADASSLPFLIRRARHASVTLLLIILAVSVVVRIFTSFLFNNDVDEGIEAVVRYRLSVEPHESLLHSSRTVRYDTKRQDGATAHYGLQRSRLPEVDTFGDGTEIGLEENTWTARPRRGW